MCDMEPESKVCCESDDWTEVWAEDWTDESLANWITLNPTWHGRPNFWFNPSNATVATNDQGESYASLKTIPQQPHVNDRFFDKKRHTLKYGTAFLRSQIQFQYGKLEAEVETSNSAISSAFWLIRDELRHTPGYEKIKECDDDLCKIRWETDIFELSMSASENKQGKIVDHSYMYHMNVHFFIKDQCEGGKTENYEYAKRYDFDEDNKNTGVSKVNERFKVGLEWTKDEMKWLVNDVVVRRVEYKEFEHGAPKNRNTVPYCREAMWIQFDMEILDWFGEPAEGEVTKENPAEFKIYRLSLKQKGGEDMFIRYHPFAHEKCCSATTTPVCEA